MLHDINQVISRKYDDYTKHKIDDFTILTYDDRSDINLNKNEDFLDNQDNHPKEMPVKDENNSRLRQN
jgi:hypothetical protein